MEDTARRDEQGTFVVEDLAEEPAAAPANRQLGTSPWLENEHVRVHPADDPLVHDLESVGESTIRFVTVALHH